MEFEKPAKFKRFTKGTDEEIDGIEFTNGMQIRTFHHQDCCEHVFADWKASLEDTGFFKDSFNFVNIVQVNDAGFLLNDYFVACYNEQSGCYSNNLFVIIFSNDESIEVIPLWDKDFEKKQGKAQISYLIENDVVLSEWYYEEDGDGIEWL